MQQKSHLRSNKRLGIGVFGFGCDYDKSGTQPKYFNVGLIYWLVI